MWQINNDKEIKWLRHRSRGQLVNLYSTQVCSVSRLSTADYVKTVLTSVVAVVSGSRSNHNKEELDHLTLLFCRIWQRTVQRFITHVQSFCTPHYFSLFSNVPVTVAVMVCLKRNAINNPRVVNLCFLCLDGRRWSALIVQIKSHPWKS